MFICAYVSIILNTNTLQDCNYSWKNLLHPKLPTFAKHELIICELGYFQHNYICRCFTPLTNVKLASIVATFMVSIVMVLLNLFFYLIVYAHFSIGFLAAAIPQKLSPRITKKHAYPTCHMVSYNNAVIMHKSGCSNAYI